MDGYIFTRICIGMLLKPYMKILKLYYMVLHFCRFLDGNCIFISVPYIYSHLFWICNLRNILFWIECNLRWNFPFQFTQFVTGDWSVPIVSLSSQPPPQIARYNVATPNTRVAAIKVSYPSAWLAADVQSVQSASAVTRRWYWLYLQTDQHFLSYPPPFLSSYPTPNFAFTIYLECWTLYHTRITPCCVCVTPHAPVTPTDLAPLALPHSSGSPLT